MPNREDEKGPTMGRMDYVDWQEASDTLNSIEEHGIAVHEEKREFVLYYGGRRAGAFTTIEGAQDELERLSHLSMKRGFIPHTFRIEKEPVR